MVQGLQAGDPARAEVWVEVKVKAEAGWADRLQQVRAEIVSAQVVEQWLLMLSDSLVIRKYAKNAAQE
jgi:hypothetical protein